LTPDQQADSLLAAIAPVFQPVVELQMSIAPVTNYDYWKQPGLETSTESATPLELAKEHALFDLLQVLDDFCHRPLLYDDPEATEESDLQRVIIVLPLRLEIDSKHTHKAAAALRALADGLENL